MRALTIHQPWAAAIARGYKRVENRAWKPPKGLSRILIHAGREWNEEGAAFCERLGLGIVRTEVTFGAIIAIATIAEIVTESSDVWVFGPYGGCFRKWRESSLSNAQGDKGCGCPGIIGTRVCWVSN